MKILRKKYDPLNEGRMRVILVWDLARLKWALRRKDRVIGWAKKVRLHDIEFKVEDGRTTITGELFAVEDPEWKAEAYAPTVALLKPSGNGAAEVTFNGGETFVSNDGSEVRWASWAIFARGILARWTEPYHPSLLLENDSVGIRDYYTH